MGGTLMILILDSESRLREIFLNGPPEIFAGPGKSKKRDEGNVGARALLQGVRKIFFLGNR